jgi:squalene synthase HpnC
VAKIEHLERFWQAILLTIRLVRAMRGAILMKLSGAGARAQAASSRLPSHNYAMRPPDALPALSPTRAIAHYENFPVASWLCPPRLRAPIAAIYHFARTADDLADEGDVGASQRLADLQAYRAELEDALAQRPSDGGRWAEVFTPLRHAIAAHALPAELLHALLDAFVQDIEKTRDGTGYPDEAALLDYCQRSANPVGRLLLHLYGVNDAQSLAWSDAICSALQLINFWQDASRDLARGRCYFPEDWCARWELTPADLCDPVQAHRANGLIDRCIHSAHSRMEFGAPLVHRVPGRAGWELRLVVQGGLRILEKVQKLRGEVLQARPSLRPSEAPQLMWRAVWMKRPERQ